VAWQHVTPAASEGVIDTRGIVPPAIPRYFFLLFLHSLITLRPIIPKRFPRKKPIILVAYRNFISPLCYMYSSLDGSSLSSRQIKSDYPST